jgi:acyl-CoA synthetase (AMP-forming)/AMP-acid ligase II
MEQHADRICVNTPAREPRPATERETVTFGEVHRQALHLAAWLRARGVREGTNVGVVAFNCAGWIVAWVAAHLLGAVPVMVNAAVVPDSMVHCLKLAQPLVVLADATSAATLSFQRQALAAAGVGEVVSWQNTDHLKTAGRVNFIDLPTLAMAPEAVRDVVEGKGFGIENQTGESDGVIFYTSGTTGYPKAVVSSQRAALHGVVSGGYCKCDSFMPATDSQPPCVLASEQVHLSTPCSSSSARPRPSPGSALWPSPSSM